MPAVQGSPTPADRPDVPPQASTLPFSAPLDLTAVEFSERSERSPEEVVGAVAPVWTAALYGATAPVVMAQ